MTPAVADRARDPSAGPRTAVVHDYMAQLGGAERVAGRIAGLFPEAELFTSVHSRRTVPLSSIGRRPWRTGFLQPLASRIGPKPLFPLLPAAFASMNLQPFDLVISSTSGFAHHVRKAPGALHIAYCHTPPRFLWRPNDYFSGRSDVRRAVAPLLALLRRQDLQAAARVDAFVAVSAYVGARIREVYGREARVVHPPVECDRFSPSPERSGRFLVLSRLVRAKRVELVIEAANLYALPLDVIGTGPDATRLARLAGPTVRLHGWQSDAVVGRAVAECTALVVAGAEDFGLVIAEAQASGRPPVAYAAGGALESIADNETGYLFREQTPEAVAEGMLRARDGRVDIAALLVSARRFDVPVFERRLLKAVEEELLAAEKGRDTQEVMALSAARR